MKVGKIWKKCVFWSSKFFPCVVKLFTVQSQEWVVRLCIYNQDVATVQKLRDNKIILQNIICNTWQNCELVIDCDTLYGVEGFVLPTNLIHCSDRQRRVLRSCTERHSFYDCCLRWLVGLKKKYCFEKSIYKVNS